MTTTRKTYTAENNSPNTHFLYYDVETVTDTRLPEGLEADIIANIKVRNKKDEAKAAEEFEEKKQKALDEFALSPLTNQVICIAYAIDDTPPRALYGKNERELLEAFVRTINEEITKLNANFKTAGRVIPVTFNGQAFDQFVLFVKTIQFGLDPLLFDLRVPKYDRGDKHVDLRSILTNFAQFGRGTCSQWAMRFGYTGKALEFDGSEIRTLFAEERWDELREKCKTDVELVRFIHNKVKRYL